jgi:aryl-alcohol dehydrogenase-like predicted oxidoreductase
MTLASAPSPASKLGLGATQFGLDNPVYAPRGRSPEKEAADSMSIAARAGVGVLDAAVQFPGAEAVIGRLLPRPTPFRVIIKAARADRGPDYVEQEARASIARLGLTAVDSIIVQSAAELFGPFGQRLWDRLRALKDAGLVNRIGVSAFASDDPVGIARRFRPDIIQAPASLLDQRLLVSGALAEIRGLGVEVQLRSIFLQGLIFMPPDRAPPNMKAAATRLSRVRRMIAEGRSDPLQAALGFALSRPEASTVIVGVTSAAELQAILAAANSPPPDLDWDDMALDDETALDPRAWAAA